MYRRSIIILISGAITLMASIIIFLLSIKDWSGVTSLAVVAIVWSELVFFGGLTFVEWISKKVEQLIIRPSMYFIIAVYTGINILISILYMMLFKWFVIRFIIIEIALLVIAIIFTLISILSASSVRNSNEYTMKSVANMENIILMLDKLAISPEYNDFATTIKKLKENLKFTDISKIVPEDKEIVEVVGDIETLISCKDETRNEKINKNLVILDTLIAKRKIAVQSIQKGKI